MKTHPKVSILIPRSQEAELTLELAQKELVGIEYEILIVETWAAGLMKAKGDYVSFLESDCVLGKNYYSTLLNSFEDKPSFRKLAMIAPAVGVNSYDDRFYGYRIGPRLIYPALTASSSVPYLVQAAYVPGALIRRSAITRNFPTELYPLETSLNMCLNFWRYGQRVLLDPRALYVTTNEAAGDAFGEGLEDETVVANYDVVELFHREAIG